MQRARNAFVAVIATVVISTLGFVALGKDDASIGSQFFDGIWNTLNLVSTVGNLHGDMTTAERAWSLIIIFGLGAVLP